MSGRSGLLGIALSLIAVFLAAQLKADTIRVTAEVEVEFAAGEGPVSEATGSFSFLYDDSFVGNDGVGDLFDIPLLSVSNSLNPIGQTVFDTTNSKGYVFYNQGSVRQVLVGGVRGNHNANSLENGSDDYWISLLVLPNQEIDSNFGPQTVVRYTNEGVFDIYDGTFVSGTIRFEAVPEPASAVSLLILGCLFTKRRNSLVAPADRRSCQ